MEDKYDYTYKLILIGDSGVGKTNLQFRFSKNDFRFDFIPTIGIDFESRSIKVDDKIIKAQIWDTPGQQRLQSITKSYYRQAVGAFIVYDITRRETFENVEYWLKELRYWSKENVFVMLLGNKADQGNLRTVQTEDAKKFAERNNINLFMETSALNTLNVDYAFTKFLTQIYNVWSKKTIDTNNAKTFEPKDLVEASRRYSQDNGSIIHIDPPRLSSDNFSVWKNRMIGFLNFVDNKLMETIKEGGHTPSKERSKWSDEDKQKVALDYKAMHILSMSLPDDIYRCVMYSESAKDMWDHLIILFEGTDETRECGKSLLIQQYELFASKPGESLTETYIRFSYLVNELKQRRKTFDNEEILIKFMRSLPIDWTMIRQTKNLKTMSLESLYGHLLAHKLETIGSCCAEKKLIKD